MASKHPPRHKSPRSGTAPTLALAVGHRPSKPITYRPAPSALSVEFDESLTAVIEWQIKDGKTDALGNLYATLSRATGDEDNDHSSKAAPSYGVELSVRVFPDTERQVVQLYVPTYNGLKALGHLFLALHERAEQTNLAVLDRSRQVRDDAAPTLQTEEA